MLACLVLLQNKRIIHCDLKPENILLYEARKADIRVIDFGSSCKEEEKVYTYIQSRFYRSPEVILGSTYGLGIDMWSFGCILAELWTGYPLFPGENEQEQLACIMEIFGPPDRHLVDRCTRKKLFFDSVGKPRVTVSSKGRRRRPSSKTLSQALKTEDEAFLDFVTRCLRWDPDRRMKPHEAVTHPFITNQPMHHRQSIPDEARRSTRARPTASNAHPGTNPSPVKRNLTTSGALPMSSHAASSAALSSTGVQQTPHKDRRGVPDTPQTSLRNPATTASVLPTANGNARSTQVSPSKQALTGNRRHSTLASANASTVGYVAGSKRTSNGAVIGASAAASSFSNGGGLPTIASNHSTASIAPASLRYPSSSNLSSAASSTSNLVSNSSNSTPAASNLAAIAARESISNAARWRG
jgi:dual specificity tyrosine-phosphorylation-regulated kinase 2/3/4